MPLYHVDPRGGLEPGMVLEPGDAAGIGTLADLFPGGLSRAARRG